MQRIIAAAALALTLVLPCFSNEVDFKTDVYPILTKHCTKCHGEKKQAGELQLHLPSAIEDFGVVVAGDLEYSSLYERLLLPEDDEQSMPKGAAPLDEKDIAVIRQWIEEGAEMPADEEVIETIEEAYNLPTVEPATAEAIARVEESGAAVIALYADSPMLQVSFAHASSPATDGSLEALAGVAKQVVSLNLARSAVTDDGLAALADLENLMRLHLENTNVTDAGLSHLSGLARLEYLNLYGTSITDEGLKQLAGLSNLRKLFLWQSEVTYDAAMSLQESLAGLEVNLGWDHPEVKKAREARMAELEAQRAAAAPTDEAQASDTQTDDAPEEATTAAAGTDEPSPETPPDSAADSAEDGEG